jgi:hypothetical protein
MFDLDCQGGGSKIYFVEFSYSAVFLVEYCTGLYFTAQ